MLARSLGLFALIVTLAGNSPIRADVDPVTKRIHELNHATGKDVIKGEYLTLKEDKDAKKIINQALKLQKNDKEALTYNGAYILAEAARDLKMVDESKALYQVCTNIAAKLESTRKLLQSYGGLIDLLYENKLYDESAKVCKELLELETGSGKPRIVYLVVTTRFGEPTFIEDENYDSVRRLKPGVHRLLIQAVAKQGKFDQALKLAENLIKAQDHWMERQLRAWVLRESGKFKEAAQAYEEIIDEVVRDKTLDQEDKKRYEDRYRYILSNVYVDLGKVKEAVAQLRGLLSRNPDEPGYYNDLGYIMANNDMNLSEAEKLIRKAIELDSERREKDPKLKDTINGAYYDSLGWVLYKQKKYNKAKDWLVKAVKDKDSQHIEIYDHLGDVYLKLGRIDEALAAWEKGVEVAGESRREQERKKKVLEKIKKNSK